MAPDGRRAVYMRVVAQGSGASSLRIVDFETGEETALPPGDKSGACQTPLGKILLEVPDWLPDGRLVSWGSLGLRIAGSGGDVEPAIVAVLRL